MSNVALSPLASAAPYNPAISRPPVSAAPWSLGWLAHKILRPLNRVRHALVKPDRPVTHFVSIEAVRKSARSLTDIDEHLELMFLEALLLQPKLIVELGVRGGTSTVVFEQVADHCGSTIISGDIEDCSKVSTNPRWRFVRDDDVQFAKRFPEYCEQLGVAPRVDLLFIDTSHYYDHTVEEIRQWFPLLATHAKVIFHDTNLRLVGSRKDGCAQLGWDNCRGVIRAVEEYLGVTIDERKPTIEFSRGWLLRHWPNCNGLTILDRIS